MPAAATAALEAERQRLAAERDRLAKDQAAFAEQQQKLKAERAETRARETEAFVAGLVKAAKLPSGLAAPAAQFAALLDGEQAVQFAEGEGKTVSKTPLQAFKDLLSALPPMVAFGEIAAAGGDAAFAADDPAAIVRAADAYASEMKAKGVTVSNQEAVRHVMGARAGAAR